MLRPLAALILLPLLPVADAPRFAVAKGTRLERSLVSTQDFKSRAIRMTIDGEDVSENMGGLEVGYRDEQRIEATDEFVALGPGRPAKLARTFDKLSAKAVQSVSADGESDEEADRERASDLEGQTVVFTWNEDDARFACEFEGGKGDATLLEGLTEDMDLRGFLPGKDVSQGDTWDLEAVAFRGVLDPGGDLKLEVEDPDAEERRSEKLRKIVSENLEGSGKATHAGTREVDGRKLLVISIEADLASEGEAEGEEDIGASSMKVRFEFEGEILWDVAAGHYRRIDLRAKLDLSMKMTQSVDFDGEAHDLVQEFDFDGEWKIEGRVK